MDDIIMDDIIPEDVVNVFLEFDEMTKQVIEIYGNADLIKSENYAISQYFKVGDEFELTIFVNEVDEEKNLLSYSAIRNNPNAQRLLRENAELKQANDNLQLQISTLSSYTEFLEETMTELILTVVP